MRYQLGQQKKCALTVGDQIGLFSFLKVRLRLWNSYGRTKVLNAARLAPLDYSGRPLNMMLVKFSGAGTTIHPPRSFTEAVIRSTPIAP